MLIRKSTDRFRGVYQSLGALWIPFLDLIVPRHDNVLGVLTREDGSVQLVAAANIITDAGDVYYAQKAAGETPTNTFANLYLSAAAFSSPAKDSDSDDLASVISGSSKAPTATYPKTNDGDSDNTGAGTDVLTWLYSYTKADFNNAAITAGAIAASGVTSWGAGAGTDPLLSAFNLTSFAKTSNDTLKFFVNHTFNGV